MDRKQKRAFELSMKLKVTGEDRCREKRGIIGSE